MIKKISLLILIAVCSVQAKYNYTMDVSGESVCISAGIDEHISALSVGMSTVQGKVYSAPVGLYMAVEAGTVTALPTHTDGEAGSPKLRYVPSSNRQINKRSTISITNKGDGKVWLTISGDAVVGTGWMLPKDGVLGIGSPYSIHAICEGTSSLSIQELY
mgnify:CR=1 FL=1